LVVELFRRFVKTQKYATHPSAESWSAKARKKTILKACRIRMSEMLIAVSRSSTALAVVVEANMPPAIHIRRCPTIANGLIGVMAAVFGRVLNSSNPSSRLFAHELLRETPPRRCG